MLSLENCCDIRGIKHVQVSMTFLQQHSGRGFFFVYNIVTHDCWYNDLKSPVVGY